MSRLQIFQRSVEAAITLIDAVQKLPPETRERGREILNETAARPLFDGLHEESKYFPCDFQYTSLTITMLIKDQEADNELMERFRSGKLEEELNGIIFQHRTGTKLEDLRIREKKAIKTFESFEELEKKAQNAAYFKPIIIPPSPLKVSRKKFVIYFCFCFQKNLNQISGNKQYISLQYISKIL